MKRSFAIIIDSAADLPQEIMKDYDIRMVNAKIIVDVQEYEDRVDISREQVIEELKTKKKVYTSQPSPADFAKHFEAVLETYEQALYLGVSSKLSGTYNNGALAAKRIAKDRIFCYDTGLVSYAVGILAYYAAIQREKGIDLKQVIKEIEQLYENIEIYIVLSELDYLHRSGRIGKAKTLIGKLLRITPILTLKDGIIQVKKIVRSEESARDYMKHEMEKHALGNRIALIGIYGEYNRIFHHFIEDLRGEYEPEIFWYEPLGTAVMCHTGPNTDAMMILKLPKDFVIEK